MNGSSYEIQVYRNGSWTIQAFFDDKELALLEARRMSETNRYPAVRVIEETVDANMDDVRQRVVYRWSEVDKHNEQIRKEQQELQEQVLEARRRRQQERQQKKPRQYPAWLHPNSYFMLALKGIGIALLGGALIYGLNVLGP